MEGREKELKLVRNKVRENLKKTSLLEASREPARGRHRRSSPLGIARNVLNEYRRHKQKENAVGNVGEIPAHHDDPGTKELLEAVRHAKSHLSDKQRQALDIALHSHLTPRDAASVLNPSENVYRQRLYDAKKRLKKFLEKFLVEF